LYVELAPEREWLSFRLTDNILSVHNCPTGIALHLKVPHKRLRLQKCSNERIYPILLFISKRCHDKLDLSFHQKKYSTDAAAAAADNDNVLSAMEKVDEIERVTKDRIQKMRHFTISHGRILKTKRSSHSLLPSFGLPRERQEEDNSPVIKKFIRRIDDSELDDDTELVLVFVHFWMFNCLFLA
jgi:hypothetical protein